MRLINHTRVLTFRTVSLLLSLLLLTVADEVCLETENAYPPPDQCLDHPDDDRRGLVVKAGESNRPHAVRRERSLTSVFTVADEPLAENFAKSTTQPNCFCTCGAFGPALRGTDCSARLSDFGPSGVIDDIGDDDNDYFIHGYDGRGGFNYLTSTSTLPLCPSTVKFDFTFFFQDEKKETTKDRTLELQVIDANNKVIMSKPVPSATIKAGGDPVQSATVLGQEIYLSDSVLFHSCMDNVRLRFAWNIPQRYTGPAQFVLDNVFVTPLPAVVRKLESETDTPTTIIALISHI
jgi:hypothetical protein